MTNDPTNDPTAGDAFEADLAASLQAAAEPVTGAGATRHGVDEAIARRRSVQRRRLGVVAAAVLLVGGVAAVATASGDEPRTVVADGGPTTTAPVTTTDLEGSVAPCPPSPDLAQLPGLVRLREEQIQELIAAELVDPATVYQGRRGPVPVTQDAVRSLEAAGLGLDGEQLFWLGYDVDAEQYLRDEEGVYIGLVCPDGTAHAAATTAPPTTTPSSTTTQAPADPVTTTTISGVATSEPTPEPTTTTLPDRDWIPEDELAEGQEVWAVYVDAISIAGPPIDGEDRAGVGEDRMYEAMAMLHDAGYELSMVPLACDLGSADAVLPILPDGPPEATAEDTWAMGFYVDGPAQADRARARLGDEVLVVAPVRISCVDVDGPNRYRR